MGNLYEVVFEDLYNKIRFKYYKIGEMIPTEKELQTKYDVSRAPIRQALDKLVNLGLIERIPGKGTFVLKNQSDQKLASMGGFGEEFIKHWDELKAYVVEITDDVFNQDVYKQLDISIDSRITRITRIRYLDDQPIFFLEHYVPNIDSNLIKDMVEINSMRDLLQDIYSKKESYTNEQVEAVYPPENVALSMKIEKNSPILKVMRTAYDQNFNTIYYSEYYVRTDKWKFRIMYNKSE